VAPSPSAGVIESFRLMFEAAKPRGYNVVTGIHIIFSLEG